MLAENSAWACVASGAYFVQHHAVLIKRFAVGGSVASGEASGARRSAMAAIAAVGELVAGGDGSAVMVTKSFLWEREEEREAVFFWILLKVSHVNSLTKKRGVLSTVGSYFRVVLHHEIPLVLRIVFILAGNFT
jgi:hypothetical protein